MVARQAILQPGELRGETRLLAAITAVLTVVGIASLYAAATFEQNAFGFFIRQLTGAAAGGVAMAIVSRVEYHHWRALAWALLLGWITRPSTPLLSSPGPTTTTAARRHGHSSSARSPS